MSRIVECWACRKISVVQLPNDGLPRICPSCGRGGFLREISRAHWERISENERRRRHPAYSGREKVTGERGRK